MIYVLYIYMCILSVELVHAIHAVHPFILRQWLRVRLCGPPPARVAIDRSGSRIHN